MLPLVFHAWYKPWMLVSQWDNQSEIQFKKTECIKIYTIINTSNRNFKPLLIDKCTFSTLPLMLPVYMYNHKVYFSPGFEPIKSLFDVLSSNLHKPKLVFYTECQACTTKKRTTAKKEKSKLWLSNICLKPLNITARGGTRFHFAKPNKCQSCSCSTYNSTSDIHALLIHTT